MEELDAADLDRLWDYDHPERTEALFRERLGAAEVSGDAGYLGQLLTQIARAQGLQGRFDDAHATLDRVETMLDEAPTVVEARYCLERGRAYRSGGDPARSLPLFQRAYDVALRAGEDGYAVDALHMLGIADEARSEEWNRKAMELASSSKDPRAQRWAGALFNNMGWTCHDKGSYEEALDLFERALVWRKERGAQKGIWIAEWCVARCLRSLGRVDEALRRQQDLSKEYAQAGQEPSPYVVEELGECLWALGKREEARPHLARAYGELSKDSWLASHEEARLKSLQERAAGEGID